MPFWLGSKRIFRSLLFAFFSVVGLSVGLPAEAAPAVVTSILPVQSLVWEVMKGAGEPALLVPANASPHSYALKPSDALTLSNAQLVFRIDPDFEQFLNQPLKNLPQDARVISLAESDGVHLLRGPEKHGVAETEDHGHGHDHDHDIDLHLWLDPLNAVIWVEEIARVLSEMDPENAATYAENARALSDRLAALIGEIEQEIAPVQSKPYAVYHDAYGYFEARFGLRNMGAIALPAEQPPSAKRLYEMRQALSQTGARCIFIEPQRSAKLARMIAQGTDIRVAFLDPLGASLSPGPDHYLSLLRRLAQDLRDCLGR